MVHGGMTWCTLCYGALDSQGDLPPARLAEPDPVDGGDLDSLDDAKALGGLPARGEGDDLGADPDTTEQHRPPVRDVDALADEMLAQLAASADARVGDGLGGRLGRGLPRTTPAKVGVTAGAGVAGCLLLLLALWLLGLLL